MKKLYPLLSWFSKAFTNIGRFVVGVLLLFIGAFLLPLVTVAAIGYYLITIWNRKQNVGEILVNNGTFSKNVAIGIDILGNIIGGPFFNWLLLTEVSSFPFGVPGEKISSVLEWNHKLGILSEWGINLRRDLGIIETDHCEKSLLNDLFEAKYTLDRYKALMAKMESIENTKAFMAKY